MWCGVVAQLETNDNWRCGSCLKSNQTILDDVTLQFCDHCRTPFVAHGHYCPCCGAESKNSPPSKLQKMGMRPSPLQPLWRLKNWFSVDPDGEKPPLCPRCGLPVRAENAQTHHYIGQANPPWNAGWDGTCASCGQRFTIHIQQQTHFHAMREVIVRPKERFHQTFIDEGVVFSGVEIETIDKPYPGIEANVSKVFISMGELAEILKALKKDQSVLFQQVDWSCDWT
jgi:hypothetical protein